MCVVACGRVSDKWEGEWNVGARRREGTGLWGVDSAHRRKCSHQHEVIVMNPNHLVSSVDLEYF